MSRDRKLLMAVITVSLLVISTIILKYEYAIREMHRLKIKGGVKLKQEYTINEIQELIKQEEGYLGDSLVVTEDGKIESSNTQFQGTINHIIQNSPDVDIIEELTRTSKLPRPVIVYRLASHYYLNQYPEEREKLEARKQLTTPGGPQTDSADSVQAHTN